MGVPRLAPWIFTNFKNSKNVLKAPSHGASTTGGTTAFATKNVDYLYIDANAILHSAAQQIFNYGEKKMAEELYMLHRIDFKTKINMVYEAFWDNILELTQVCGPKKFLYIAIDGTAPVAKQVQQRQRRFVAARESLKSGGNTAVQSGGVFNSNCISPGTEFMDDLSKFISQKTEEYVTQNKKIAVIFSPPTDPGEGEHKIMNFIRKRMDDDEVFSQSSHCIYSPDGDLIMLCLTTYLDNIFLLRNSNEPRSYDFINMSFVQKNLCRFCYASNIMSRNKHDVVNDFVFAGFFVGNDFLPKVQMFYTLEEGLQSMIDVCKTISQKNKFLTSSGKINQSSLVQFVSIVGGNEIQHLRFQASVKNRDGKFDDEMCRRHFANIPPGAHIPLGFLETAYEAYADEYYTSRFPAGVSRNEICKEYLKSLIWVFIYYTQGLPSWRFYYKYSYAPLMKDFGNYLTSLEAFRILSSENVFDMGKPCHPYVQLLCILPSTSKNLLPEEYRDLIEESDLDFKIDYAGKTKEHFGVALIEHANVDKAEKKFMERTKRKLERGYPMLYFWDDGVQTMELEYE